MFQPYCQRISRECEIDSSKLIGSDAKCKYEGNTPGHIISVCEQEKNLTTMTLDSYKLEGKRVTRRTQKQTKRYTCNSCSGGGQIQIL